MAGRAAVANAVELRRLHLTRVRMSPSNPGETDPQEVQLAAEQEAWAASGACGNLARVVDSFPEIYYGGLAPLRYWSEGRDGV
eukprot:10557529-Alexandrium_andersonii.AAC.1